jgi:phosphoglycerate dehydrogenase-like enzyme
MRANLKEAIALVVESIEVGREDLAAGEKLKIVQKFGVGLRNIDVAACADAGVKVRTLRRRANISCAEHAITLMLALARKLDRVIGRVTVEHINATGPAYRPFDRRYTPNANYGRIGGTLALNGATLGLIGLGEIGREIAVRAAAFGMRVLYYQRTRAPEREEIEARASYVSLGTLLAESDWIVPQVPGGPGTRDLLGRPQFPRIKPGARIVNISNAHVIDRHALIEALRAGRLGGFASDVFYEEPPAPDDELFTFDNVIFTPHMAGSPRFNGLNDFEELITGLARALAFDGSEVR